MAQTQWEGEVLTMALPKQIQQQADAVAEFERKVAEQQAQAQPPGDPPPEAPPVAQPVPALTPEPATNVEVPSAAPVEPKRDDGQWEQKYRTLQGMFARETQTLRGQLQTVTEQLTAVNEQMKAQREPPAKPSALVTEKDVEAFGGDLVDMARRVARDEFAAREADYKDRISALESQIRQQVGEVKQTQQQSARESFFSRLQQALPNWEQVQATAECQQWLAARVPGSAFTWNDVLVDAANQNDAPRAIEVFQTFMATLPQPRQAEPNPRAKNELSRQVTPPKSNAVPNLSAEKRLYTSAEYEAESQKIIRLTKQGRYDDAARIETELNAALAEGRLRP